MRPLVTERLKILPWQRNDIDDAFRLWGDPKVTALIDARGALTLAQVAQKLDDEILRQEKHGFQYWKVVDKASGELIGCCGLRHASCGDAGVLELGFHIVSAKWGRGYATEAARAVVQYAFEVMKVPKLFAGHNPKNTASKLVLEKLGFQSIGARYYAPAGLEHPSYELAHL